MSEESEDFFYEERSIDPDRIVNDEYLLANELLCSICQGLLWKARCCSSCQHLFCQTCLDTWHDYHPNVCPYRCTPFHQKRAPPAIQSLLTRLSMGCRNHFLGCNEILSYNNLEEHERMHCHYRTRTCRTCREDLPLDQMVEHRIRCEPKTSLCPFCREQIDRDEFHDHLGECLEDRMASLLEQILPEEETTQPTNEPIALPLLQRYHQRLQEFLRQFPKEELNGFNELRRSRDGTLFVRLSSMLEFLILNRSVAARILLALVGGAWGVCIGLQLALILYFQSELERSLPRTVIQMMLSSGLISFGAQFLLNSITDRWLIPLIILLFLLIGSLIPALPVDYLRIGYDIRIAYAGCFLVLGLLKLSLLIVRFYFRSIPSYLTAGLLAWLMMFLSFSFRRSSLHLL